MRLDKALPAAVLVASMIGGGSTVHSPSSKIQPENHDSQFQTEFQRSFSEYGDINIDSLRDSFLSGSETASLANIIRTSNPKFFSWLLEFNGSEIKVLDVVSENRGDSNVFTHDLVFYREVNGIYLKIAEWSDFISASGALGRINIFNEERESVSEYVVFSADNETNELLEEFKINLVQKHLNSVFNNPERYFPKYIQTTRYRTEFSVEFLERLGIADYNLEFNGEKYTPLEIYNQLLLKFFCMATPMYQMYDLILTYQNYFISNSERFIFKFDSNELTNSPGLVKFGEYSGVIVFLGDDGTEYLVANLTFNSGNYSDELFNFFMQLTNYGIGHNA